MVLIGRDLVTLETGLPMPLQWRPNLMDCSMPCNVHMPVEVCNRHQALNSKEVLSLVIGWFYYMIRCRFDLSKNDNVNNYSFVTSVLLCVLVALRIIFCWAVYVFLILFLHRNTIWCYVTNKCCFLWDLKTFRAESYGLFPFLLLPVLGITYGLLILKVVWFPIF